ncbi:MAG TPA: hypothetical protein VF828_04600, partial [Patescibacteria group bacterium]
DEGKRSLAGIIQDFRSVPTETLIGFIAETVKNAEVGIWKGGGKDGGPIGVGFFSSKAVYNTYLLHETGHKVLFLSGGFGDGVKYENGGEDREERFCYRFSRQSCKVLGLRYSTESEEVNLKIMEVRQRMTKYSNRDPRYHDLVGVYNQLWEKEAELLGIVGECQPNLVRNQNGRLSLQFNV